MSYPRFGDGVLSLPPVTTIGGGYSGPLMRDDAVAGVVLLICLDVELHERTTSDLDEEPLPLVGAIGFRDR